MVVAHPALYQSCAGEVFINTKVCCILRGIEYAGYSMDRPASDRRLRPRTTCPHCKRLESLCVCKMQAQRTSRSKTAQASGEPSTVASEMSTTMVVEMATTSSQLAGVASSSSTIFETTALETMELTSSGLPPLGTGISVPGVGAAVAEPVRLGLVSAVGAIETIDMGPGPSGILFSTKKQDASSMSSSQKLFGDFPTSSESSDPTSSESSQVATSDTSSSFGPARMELEATSVHQFQPILSRPSTSQSPAICETPKRTDLALTSRRLVPGAPQKSEGSKKHTIRSQTTSRSPTHIQDPTLPSPSSQLMAKETTSITRKPTVFKGPIRERSYLPHPEEESAGTRTAMKGSKVRKAPSKKSKSQKSSLRGPTKALGTKSGPPSIKGFQSVTEAQHVPEEFISAPSTSRGLFPTKYTRKGKTPSSHKGHVCSQCGKAFGSPGKLSQHMFSHTGERPFPCGECSKAFSSKFKLVRHNLIHSAVRRFVCGQCGRQFHRKDHLQNHAKIHAAVKLKFRCDREGCNKEYTSANSARKHSATHAAQDGQLDCLLCGRMFSSTAEVLHHLKVHAGSRAVKTQADRKFTCEVCDRSFFTRKDVRRHLVVHTGLRDFLCQFCPQRFGRKDHLVRHIKKSHQSSRAKPRKKSKRVESSPSPSTSRDPGSSPGLSSLQDTSPPVSRDLGSIPGPSTAQDPGPLLPRDILTLKEEPDDFELVKVKQEEVHGVQTITIRELPQDIPMYPLPPYPSSSSYPSSDILSPSFMKGFMKGFRKSVDEPSQSYAKPPEDLGESYAKSPEQLSQPFPKTSEGLSQTFPKLPEGPEPFPKPPDDLAQSYAKPSEDLSQFYSIVPDIQSLFTAGEGNGQLLMSLMESVEMSTSNEGSEMMPSTSQVVGPSELSSDAQTSSLQPLLLPPPTVAPPGSVDLATSLGERILASTGPPEPTPGPSLGLGLREPSLAERLLVPADPDAPSTSRAVLETLLKEEGDNNSAPLPRFDQAFPPQ